MNTCIVPPRTTTRLPSLDGWRAISIVLVLGSHSENTAGFPNHLRILFNWLFEGNLGVRFFFVISGFLITWLMVLEKDRTGHVNLRHFYIRRALRILPVYFAFILTLTCLQLFTPYTQSISVWIGNLTFTTDFINAGVWTSGHLWSLSVEEQFYLVWPAIFLFCNFEKRFRLTALILTLPILLAPIFRVITYTHASPSVIAPLFSGFSFFNYFDSLAAGCVSAILFKRKHDKIKKYLIAWPSMTLAVAFTLILIPYALIRLFIFGFFTVPLGSSFQALGFAILLLQSIILPGFGFYHVLNWRWVREIGVLSYSIYIWQQIFSTKPQIFGLGNVWWMSFPGWFVPVFIVAMISYYGLEQPLFRLRAHFREVKVIA